MTDTVRIFFSLGSNMGDRAGYIRKAIEMMEYAFCTKAAAVADLIETEPVGFESEDKFLNTAVLFDIPAAGQNAELHSLAILRECKRIEAELGRDIKDVEYDSAGNRIYRSRPIDIDILLYGDSKICTPELTIPHKDMYSRDFVMIPLMAIL